MDSIRLMREADIPAADSILEAARKVDISYAGILARNWRLTPDSYWLLEPAGRPVGVVGYTDFGGFARGGLMAILPDYQVGGAGSHLLRLIEARGFASIMLYSTDAGLAFSPKHGFCWSGLSTAWHLRKRKPAARQLEIATVQDPATGGDGGCLGFTFAQASVIGPMTTASPEVAFAPVDAEGRLARVPRRWPDGAD